MTIGSPYLDKVNHPLYFILEIPNNVASSSGLKQMLQKGIHGITNITLEDGLSYILDKQYSTKEYIILPKLPYSSARIKFDISAENTFQSVIKLEDILPQANSPLFTYSLLGKGNTLANSITDIFTGLTKTGNKYVDKVKVGKEERRLISWEKLKNDESLSGFKEFGFGMLGAMADFGSFLARKVGDVGNDIGKTLGNITNDMANDSTIKYKNFENSIGTYNVTSSEGTDMSFKEVSSGIINFNAFITPKLWAGSSNPFPQIELGLSYVCEKDTDTVVDLINWIQQISSPLTLLVPVLPLRLSFYNIIENHNTLLSDKPHTNNGLRPFTYTQHNYGYFNLINAKIEDMGIGVANNTNSEIYKGSGIPMPIGVNITLTLEAFDPFFYQQYSPSKLYDNNDTSTTTNKQGKK